MRLDSAIKYLTTKLGKRIVYPIITVFPVHLSANGEYDAKCLGFMLQNAGNTTVILNDSWTMKPGSVFNSFNDLPSFERTRIKVRFLEDAPAGETVNNRLEIVEKHIDSPEFFDWCKIA